MFAVRILQNLSVFELRLVAERWHKDYQLLVDPPDFHMGENSNVAEVQVSTIDNKVSSISTLSKNQNYKKAQRIGQKLAAIVSGYGMAKFRRKFHTMESLLNFWEETVK